MTNVASMYKCVNCGSSLLYENEECSNCDGTVLVNNKPNYESHMSSKDMWLDAYRTHMRGDFKNAYIKYHDIIKTYPDTDEANKAKAQLETFSQEQLTEAVKYAENNIKNTCYEDNFKDSSDNISNNKRTNINDDQYIKNASDVFNCVYTGIGYILLIVYFLGFLAYWYVIAADSYPVLSVKNIFLIFTLCSAKAAIWPFYVIREILF